VSLIFNNICLILTRKLFVCSKVQNLIRTNQYWANLVAHQHPALFNSAMFSSSSAANGGGGPHAPSSFGISPVVQTHPNQQTTATAMLRLAAEAQEATANIEEEEQQLMMFSDKEEKTTIENKAKREE
jgi:hypothetical protein